MKKIYLFLIIGVLLVSGVIAGIGIGALNKQRSLDIEQINMLLTKTDAKEINPNVIIKCSDDYCLWGANQEGIINTKNNLIKTYRCLEYNQTNGDCLDRLNYTDDEIQDMVADEILFKLENYANAEISREVYEDWGTGNVEIVEE